MEGQDEGDGVEVYKINEGRQKWRKEKQKEKLEELPAGLAWLIIFIRCWLFQPWDTKLLKYIEAQKQSNIVIILMHTLAKCCKAASSVV